jgi:hypothetical protein
MFSNNYSARAGRVIHGNALSPYCNCGEVSASCYDDAGQACNYEGYSLKRSSSTETGTTDNKTGDATSLGLMFFVTAYLFRRFLL